MSYGVYQLSSNAGTLQSFLRNEGRGYATELGGGIGGTPFNASWKAIAARDPAGFRAAQHAFIERTHYQPAVDSVRGSTGRQGGTRSTGSAGCQTLNPTDFNALLSALGGQRGFSYILVNAGR